MQEFEVEIVACLFLCEQRREYANIIIIPVVLLQ